MMSSTRTYIGIALMIAYAIFMAFCDAIAKELSSLHMVVAIVWYRYVFHTITLAILTALHYIKVGKPEVIGSHIAQILRGLTLVLSTLVFFNSIAIMPLAEALALLYIFPVISVVLSLVFLKEKLTAKQASMIALGVIGVIFILSPSVLIHVTSETVEISSEMSLHIPSEVYALASGVLMGIYMFLTKTISSDSTPLISSLYAGVIGILCIPVFPGFEFLIFEPKSFVLGALMGAFAGFGHFSMFRSMSYAPASVVSPFAFSEIIFASIIGYFWFLDTLTLTKLVGIALLITSGIVFAVHSKNTTVISVKSSDN